MNRAVMTDIATTIKTQQEMQDLQRVTQAFVLSAEVVEVTKQGDTQQVKVRADDGEIMEAQVMLSCLVELLEHDRVLVIHDDSGKNYVSGVVSRVSDEPIVLASGRDLIIKVPNLSVQTDMLAMSANALYQSANDIQQCAEKIAVVSQEYEQAGGKANINFSEVNAAANTLTSRVKFLFEKIGVISRTVDQLEKIDVNMRQDTVRTQLVINAGNAQINSKSSIQMNARQIFMN